MRGTVAVAASGGRDSTALLHATAHVAARLGLQVVALHVHHGLMPQADAWQRQLQRQCARWRRRGLPVTLRVTRLHTAPQRGDSIEAWARHERYRALALMARACGASLVLLAHHRRDQAETFLLQALRGAGPAGLASMPAMVQREDVTWARPWLRQPRQAIEHYVQRHRLGTVDDPSNADARLARAVLRTRVWPGLLQASAAAETTLAASAALAAQADDALRAWSAQALQQMQATAHRLPLLSWLALSPGQRAWVLRAWLGGWMSGDGTGPPRQRVAESLVQRLLTEWPAAASGARWHAGALAVQRHGDALIALPQAATRDGNVPRVTCMDLSQPGAASAPGWGGGFIVSQTKGPGLPARWLHDVALRERAGAEQFQAHPAAPPRSLKKSFQTAGVPDGPWRRGPLVYSKEGRLLYVPGLGADARALRQAPRDASRTQHVLLTLRWRPDAVLGALDDWLPA